MEIFSVATIRRWNLVNPFMTNLFSLIILLHQQHEFISFTIIILLFIPFVEFYGMNKKPFNKMVYTIYNTCCFQIRNISLICISISMPNIRILHSSLSTFVIPSKPYHPTLIPCVQRIDKDKEEQVKRLL